jgi:hypothetical protein
MEQEIFSIYYEHDGEEEYYLVTSSTRGVALNNDELTSEARRIVTHEAQARKTTWWNAAKEATGGYPKTQEQWDRANALPSPNLSTFPCPDELVAREQFRPPTKIIKAKYYLTVMAEVKLEIPEGRDEDAAVRDYLPDIPANAFNVLTADMAEIEDDTGEKREVML